MTTITRLISSLLVALILAAAPSRAALVSGVTVGETYTSSLIEKGIKTDSANLVTDVGFAIKGVTFGATVYAPTTVGLSTFSSHLNRTDLSAGLKVDSKVGAIQAGVTFKHFGNVLKVGQGDQWEPSVVLTTKGLPTYVGVHYNVATRAVNLEGGVHFGVPLLAGFKVVPSAYAGYNDIADVFPHSLKAVKANNRYYGVGVGLSHSLFGGNLVVGGTLNRADQGFANQTAVYSVGWSVAR